MKTTTNYDLKKPESIDYYDVENFNDNFETIDTELKSVSDKADTATAHISDTSNPHSVTKEQVGLGNVPNVATNDQTPTYTVASANTALSSGEKLSAAMGKIAKAVSSLISHLSDTVGHITVAERTAWNAKLDKTAKAADSDKLDGFDSLSFMRRVNGYGSGTFNSYDLNVWTIPGCYSCESAGINVPPGIDGWGDVIVFGGIDGRVTQIFRPWNKSNFLYWRSLNGTTWGDWASISDGGNADTLDGKHASDFLPITGGILAQPNSVVLNLHNTTTNSLYSLIYFYANSVGLGALGFMGMNTPILYATDGSTRDLLHTGNSAKVIVSNTAPTDTTALWVS